MKCFCGAEIPIERSEAGYATCIEHSNAKKPVGFMVYGHKTAGEIVIVNKDDEETLRQAQRAYRRSR